MSTPPVPGISVVIPTHGRAEYLGRALASVAAQNLLAAQVIVVDDNGRGSEHQLASELIVQGFAGRLPMHYVANERNRGGGFTRNAGVAVATGEFIGFLDDDDEWLPDFLLLGVQALQTDTADVAYCDCYVVDDQRPGARRLEVNRKYKGEVWEPLLSGWCPSSTSLFTLRRSAILGRTLFDERLASFQDYDCWLSLARHCRFTWHDTPSVLKHTHGGEQLTTNTGRRREALTIFTDKWLPQMAAGEAPRFRQALARLDKNIHRAEFRNAVRAGHWSQALTAAGRFVCTGGFSPRDLVALWKTARA